MASFSYHITDLEEMKTELTQMEHAVQTLKETIETQSEHQKAVAKISKIINQYNQKLTPREKYEIANEIYNMSIKYENLDVDLICATITHETAFTWQPDIKSPVGAIGLMQIMPYTGLLLSRHEGITCANIEEVLTQPILNIRLGCRYLSMLIEIYNLDGGLAAYNGGERRAARWLASGRDDEMLFEETRKYVPAVLNLYDTFRN